MMNGLRMRMSKTTTRIADYNIFGYQIPDHIEGMGQINIHKLFRNARLSILQRKVFSHILNF